MLSTHNLTCRRSGRIIFRDLSFEVVAGGFLSVTGANGSGKSSLLRLLAGLIAPAAGHILWHKEAVSLPLHYIGHHDALKPILTAREMLAYWRALRTEKAGDDVRTLSTFDLVDLADTPVRLLSAGQKKRLSLTRLVLATAPVWLLDEPTAALDAASQKLLFDHIAQHRAQGGIVIAATHDALDIEDMQHLTLNGTSA